MATILYLVDVDVLDDEVGDGEGQRVEGQQDHVEPIGLARRREVL